MGGGGPLSHGACRWANCRGYGETLVTAVIETLQVVFFLYISPLHAVRIENMELTENIFLHCSSQRETLQREGWKRFSPTLFFVFSATSSPVLVLPLNMRVAQGENGNVHKNSVFSVTD